MRHSVRSTPPDTLRRFCPAAMVLALLVGGCEPQVTNPVPRRAAVGFIALVGASEEDPLWLTFRAAAESYRPNLAGFELRVAAPPQASVADQLALLRSFDPAQMRGLCIQPVDAALGEELQLLHQKGVAVVTMMTRVVGDESFPHTGVDEMAVGRAMADAALEAVDGKGAIAVVDHAGGDRALGDRRVGFSERLSALAGLNVLREFDCRGTPDTARTQIRDYMERFPRLNGWVALDNWPLRQWSAQTSLLPASCQIVSCKPYPEYWPLILDDTCHALVGARYEQIAEHALRMCVTGAQGQLPTTRTFLAPPVTVTKQNLAWFRQHWFDTRKMPAEAAATPAPTSTPDAAE